jgi:hypothetical protein
MASFSSSCAVANGDDEQRAMAKIKKTICRCRFI